MLEKSRNPSARELQLSSEMDSSPSPPQKVASYTDQQFWEAFPPDDPESVPDDGDFWIEIE